MTINTLPIFIGVECHTCDRERTINSPKNKAASGAKELLDSLKVEGWLPVSFGTTVIAMACPTCAAEAIGEDDDEQSTED